MELVVSNPQQVDTWGGQLAPLLIPRCEGPPVWENLLIVSQDLENDHPLALSVARHWGSISHQRGNECACWPMKRGQNLPQKIVELLPGRRPVIVAWCISQRNAPNIYRAAKMLGTASGRTVTIGAIKDEIGKHNGFNVCTPAGT